AARLITYFRFPVPVGFWAGNCGEEGFSGGSQFNANGAEHRPARSFPDESARYGYAWNGIPRGFGPTSSFGLWDFMSTTLYAACSVHVEGGQLELDGPWGFVSDLQAAGRAAWLWEDRVGQLVDVR